MKLEVAKIADLLAQFKGTTAAMITVNGDVLYALNEQAAFKSASLIKVAILDYVLEHQLDLDQLVPITDDDRVLGAGVLHSLIGVKELSLANLLMLMINVSDNMATNLVIKTIGSKTMINEWLANQGYVVTQLNRNLMDSVAVSKGIDNYTNAEEILSLFRKVVTNRQVSSWFLNQQFRYKLPGNFDEVETAVKVFNKTGEGAQLDHDVARFSYQGNVIDVVVLTSGFSNRSENTALISQLGQLLLTQIKG